MTSLTRRRSSCYFDDLPRRPGRRLRLQESDVHVGGDAANGRFDCGTQGFPPSRRRSRQRRSDGARRVPPAAPDRTVSAACASSTSATSRIRSRSPPCRPAAARTRIRWSSIRMTRTTSISTSPARRSSVKAKNWPDARAKQPDKDPNTALFRIDVIKVPLAPPQDAKIVSSSAHLHGSANRRHQRLWKGGNHGKAGRPSRRTPIVPRHHRLFGHRARRGRLLRQRHPAGHQRPRESRTHRRRQRSELRLLALRQFFQRRHEGPVH